MASVTKAPGTVVSDPTDTYLAAAWANLTGPTVKGGAAAFTNFVTASSKNTTPNLRVTNFGFDIPTGATIDGIAVNVIKKGGNMANGVQDYNVKLCKASIGVGSNHAKLGVEWNTAGMTPEDYGSPTDKWGTAWTPAEINSSGFGFEIASQAYTNGTNQQSLVDYVEITVYYTEGSGAAADTTSFFQFL